MPSNYTFDKMGLDVFPEDLNALLNLVAHANAFNIIEIGSWAGLSTLAICAGLDIGSRVYCIDTWQGNPTDCLAEEAAKRTPRQAFQTFCRNMNASLFRKVIPLVGHSLTYAAIWPRSVDLIFIDADHRYEHVKADIEAWWPHVKPGGVLCGHDYGVGNLPGVQRAVDEFFDSVRLPVRVVGKTVWAVTKPA